MTLVTKLFLAFLSAAYLSVTPVTHARAADFSDQDVIQHFVKLAFGGEFVDDDAEIAKQLKKWDEDWRVLYSGDQKYAGLINGKLDKILGFTSIDWEPVSLDNWKSRNIVLAIGQKEIIKYFVDAVGRRDKWGATVPEIVNELFFETDQKVCISYIDVDSKARIREGFVFIETRDSYAQEVEFVAECLEEELAQLLGLPNDRDNFGPTLFNSYNDVKELTELDKRALGLLYRQELKPGMSEDSVRGILQKILQ